MAEIKPITTNESLLESLKDFMNDPRFNPKNQNKYFFSTGMSYYQQLCSVLKMLEGFAEAFSLVWENEQTLAQGIVTKELLNTELQGLKNLLEGEIQAIESGTETRFSGIEQAMEGFRETINSMNQQLALKLRSVSITGTGIDVYNEGIFDGVQRIRLTAQSGPGLTLSQNLAYANSAVSSIATGASAKTADKGNALNDGIEIASIENGAEASNALNVSSFSALDFARGSANEIRLKQKGISKVGTEGNVIFNITEDSTGAMVLNGSVDGSAFASASALASTDARLAATETVANRADSTSASNTTRIGNVEEFISNDLPVTYAKKSELSAVATTGAYNDLSGKPELKAVATTGSYNDLTDKPSIPSIPANNVTGTGTAGYLAKFSAASGISNGPQLGTSTETFLRNDGTWAKAGGFSGVDMNNVLFACASGTEFDYTATEDCIYWASAITNNIPFEFDGTAIEKQSFAIGSFPLKKGTHIKGKTAQGYLRIYGLK